MPKKNKTPSLKKRIQRRWRQIKWLSLIFTGLLLVNFVVQIARKPSEALGLVPTTMKTPYQTWQSYRDEFKESATPIITADFLAAVAQAESAGDPVAQPRWVFRWTTDLFRIYGPPSSAVGLMQITEGNYEEAKNYCIRDGKVETSCWFNWYARFLPSHSIEMAAAFMHVQVEKLVGLTKVSQVSIEKLQNLAAIVHLCGKGRGPEFLRSGFRVTRDFQPCGSHDPGQYLQKISLFKRQFSRMLASDLQ